MPAMIDQSKRHSGGKKGRHVPPKHLKDLRWVYNHPKEEDKTQAHTYLRGIYENSPKEFMGMMQKAQDSYVMSRKTTAAEAPKEKGVDLGAEKCVALAEGLIKELSERGG